MIRRIFMIRGRTADLLIFPLIPKYVTLNNLEWPFCVKFCVAPVCFGALKPGFRSLATLELVVNFVGKLYTENKSCGTAPFSCYSTAFLFYVQPRRIISLVSSLSYQDRKAKSHPELISWEKAANDEFVPVALLTANWHKLMDNYFGPTTLAPANYSRHFGDCKSLLVTIYDSCEQCCSNCSDFIFTARCT